MPKPFDLDELEAPGDHLARAEGGGACGIAGDGAMSDGSIVKLSELINGKVDTVCVLRPYQDKISENHPENVVINRYLKDIKYRANESYWSLVTLTSFSVTHYTFKRSKVLDIFTLHSQNSLAAVAIPANFEMAECVSFEQAALFKTVIFDRAYMIFGSVK